MDDVAIKVTNVSKTFKLPHERQDSIKNALIHFGKGKKGYERQHVLNNVDFEIQKGEFFGIVGRNGSGKSTLLKLLAGIYIPDEGAIHINGKLTPFIELGVGFNPELTGRENVFLNGALLGFNHKEVEAMYNDIVSFAELSRFMDQKLKNYSSGMQVRLAFSIAIRAQSDILVLDEVLAVGDEAFQRKCFEYFAQLKHDKKTVVLVSHDMGAVERYCDRAILLEKSNLILKGKSNEVAREYRRILQDNDESGVSDQKSDRLGNGAAQITGAKFYDLNHKPLKQLKVSSEGCVFSMEVRFTTDVEAPIFGITLRDDTGKPLLISNTDASHIGTGNFSKGDTVTVSWRLQNIFNSGHYRVTPAVAATDGLTIYDSRDDFANLVVDKDTGVAGAIHLDYDISLTKQGKR
jgi:ABC-2 type transport system ATP-binding protein